MTQNEAGDFDLQVEATLASQTRSLVVITFLFLLLTLANHFVLFWGFLGIETWRVEISIRLYLNGVASLVLLAAGSAAMGVWASRPRRRLLFGPVAMFALAMAAPAGAAFWTLTRVTMGGPLSMSVIGGLLLVQVIAWSLWSARYYERWIVLAICGAFCAIAGLLTGAGQAAMEIGAI